MTNELENSNTMNRIFTILMFCFLSNHGFGQKISTLFEREAQYQHFQGCVLIQQNGTVAYKACFGQANDRFDNSPDIFFDIGSVSKHITAAGILHLVAQNKISLQSPINQYLGRFQNPLWKEVTIHHLLTHTSGIPSLFQSGQGLEMIMPDTTAVSLTDLITYFKDAELLFDPGDEYRYSNSGYILLAAIIEEVAGKTYEEYMDEFFKHYGLAGMQFGPTDNFELMAMPYFGYRGDIKTKAPLIHRGWTIGAGGIYATLEGMQDWMRLIQSERFLTPELRKAYLSGHVKKGEGKAYGYGWDVLTVNEKRIEHTGLNFGYVAYAGFEPDNGNSIVVLTNSTYQSLVSLGNSEKYVMEVVDKCWKHLSGDEIDYLPEIQDSDIDVGRYQFENGYQVAISPHDSLYLISHDGDFPPTQLIFNNPLPQGNDIRVDYLYKIAHGLKNDRYWGMAPAFSWMMKLLIFTGVFEWGFGEVTQGLGTIHKAVPYAVDDGHGLIRLYGDEGILDLIAYFNESGKVMGVFENGWYEPQTLDSMLCFPIGKNQLYLDGFPYGEFSAHITITEECLIVEQQGRSFTAKRIDLP